MASDRGIEIQIFGQVYHLKGDDPEHTRRVAKLVDDRMNYLADHVQTADSYRVAVLAALHIADELITHRTELDSYRSRVDESSIRMLELLDGGVRGPDSKPVEDGEVLVREATALGDVF